MDKKRMLEVGAETAGGLKINSRSVDVCREERSIFNPTLALGRFREQIPDSKSWPQAAHVRGLEAVAMSRFPAVGPRKVRENGFPLGLCQGWVGLCGVLRLTILL